MPAPVAAAAGAGILSKVGGLAGVGSLLSGLGSLGGLFGGGSKARKNAEMRNYAMQKEFAQNQLQWRAADARKAGLHPMAALGAAGQGFTPFLGGQAASGSHWSDAAQDMGRAVSRIAAGRQNAYEKQQGRYERRLQQMRLESEIAANNALTAQRQAEVERRKVAPGSPVTVVDSAFGPSRS